MVYVEQRMFTDAEQIVAVGPNETEDGLILKTSELDGSADTRLYLTLEEAEELSSMLISLVSKLHGLKVKSK